MEEVKMSESELGKFELDYIRRKKRNEEVDQLIQNIGDPRVAERLRIYRMVEEKFIAVENQIRSEVKQELLKKKQQKPDSDKRPKSAIKDAERVLRHNLHLKPSVVQNLDIHPSRLPRVFSPPASRNQESRPGVFVKYKPLSLKSVSKHFDFDDSSSTFSQESFCDQVLVGRSSSRFRDTKKHEPKQNVGIINYVYQDTDYRHRKWMKLTGHLLQGVDIQPSKAKPVNQLVKTVLDCTEHKIFVSTEDDLPMDSVSEAVAKDVAQNQRKIKFDCEAEASMPCPERTGVKNKEPSDELSCGGEVNERALPTHLKISPVQHLEVVMSPVASEKDSHTSSSYSMNFEEGEGDEVEIPVFSQRSPEFYSSVGSATDRLSTIPEDSRSQDVDDEEVVTKDQQVDPRHVYQRHSEASFSPFRREDNVSSPSMNEPEEQASLLTSEHEEKTDQATPISDRGDYKSVTEAKKPEEDLAIAKKPSEDVALTNPIIEQRSDDIKVSGAQALASSDLEVLTFTKSAKTMLEMLDEMSLSQGVLSDVSLRDFDLETSSQENKKSFSSPFRPPLPRTSGRTSKSHSSSTSTNSYSNSSIPFYSGSTSYTSGATSLDAELSEGPLS